MKNFCYQGGEHDCGFASLKMLLATISKNKNYLLLPKPVKKEEYSFLDLIEIAATHQVFLAGYELEFNKIAEQKLPMIVRLRGNHAVLLTKINKGLFYFNDPDRGKVLLKENEFREVYDGHVLMVENENLDRTYKVSKPRLLPKSFTLIHVLLSVLVTFVLGLNFYLMNLSENIPFIFLLIMFLILVEVFENWFVLKTSNKFDEQYIPQYFKRKRYQNAEDYQKYLTVRSGVFSSSKSLFIYGSVALVLGVLVSINDLRNLLIIAIIAIYKATEKYLTQFKDEKIIRELSIQENEVFDHPEQCTSRLILLNQKASNHGLNLAIRNCFFQLVLMFLTLLMMVLSKNMSANFAVFHFGIYFVIGQGITLLFDRITEYQNFVKKLTQFYDRCDL